MDIFVISLDTMFLTWFVSWLTSSYSPSCEELFNHWWHIVSSWYLLHFGMMFNKWWGWIHTQWLSLRRMWQSSFWVSYNSKKFMRWLLLSFDLQRLYRRSQKVPFLSGFSSEQTLSSCSITFSSCCRPFFKMGHWFSVM